MFSPAQKTWFAWLLCASLIACRGPVLNPLFARRGDRGGADFSQLTVLERGRAPQRFLRYDFSTVQPQVLLIRMQLGSPDGDRPKAVLQTELGLVPRLSQTPDKKQRFDFWIADTAARWGLLPNGEESLRGVDLGQQKAAGSILVDSRGRLAELQLTDPAAKKSIRNYLRLAIVRLPNQAVGVGARWQIADRSAQKHFDLSRTLTVTLVRFENNQLQLHYEICQQAEPSQRTTHLNLVEVSGAGSATLEPGALFPEVEANLRVLLRVALEEQPAIDTTFEVQFLCSNSPVGRPSGTL